MRHCHEGQGAKIGLGRVVEMADGSARPRPSTRRPDEALGRFAQGERSPVVFCQRSNRCGMGSEKAGESFDGKLQVNLPFAHGGPPLTGVLKSEPEDFEVEEVLGFDADGLGEHDLLWVEKRGNNTQWLADELARFAKVPQIAVGYAGLKDRQSVSRQHFSVQLPGRQVDWSALSLPGVRVLKVARHSRKLKRGALTGNRFVLRVRAICGDRDQAHVRFEQLVQKGAPNFFGEQRFGIDGGNLERARRLFAGARMDRQQRAFALSAARSEIFNAVLAERVAQGNWDLPIAGELCMLDGRRAYFGPADPDAELCQRVVAGDVHPSGPLWGCGENPSARDCAELEQRIAAQFPEFTAGLARAQMDHERRALRVCAKELQLDWDATTLQLRFELPAGAYATAFVRELLELTVPLNNSPTGGSGVNAF